MAYKGGGAQAAAAAAFGTETVERALKIVGPGSPWVVAAKRSPSILLILDYQLGRSEVFLPMIVFAVGLPRLIC